LSLVATETTLNMLYDRSYAPYPESKKVPKCPVTAFSLAFQLETGKGTFDRLKSVFSAEGNLSIPRYQLSTAHHRSMHNASRNALYNVHKSFEEPFVDCTRRWDSSVLYTRGRLRDSRRVRPNSGCNSLSPSQIINCQSLSGKANSIQPTVLADRCCPRHGGHHTTLRC
jgi:hypothetical protein